LKLIDNAVWSDHLDASGTNDITRQRSSSRLPAIYLKLWSQTMSEYLFGPELTV
jgi:hypothetical protein